VAKTDKLLGQVQSHLEQGERVDAYVAGTYETKVMGSATVRNGVFLATDRRLVFYAKKMGGYDFESFPYANISSFEQSKGTMGHSIRFFASGNVVTMKWIKDDPAVFGEFVRLVTERAGRKPSSDQSVPPTAAQYSPQPGVQASAHEDVFEALRKLGELRDAGIVTPEEFEAKKKDLLDRI
jgi:hypothetical protein